MSTEATYEDLLDALGRSGCAICRLATRRADRFLASYIYEHVNDVDLRSQIRSSRGFCEPHGEQFLEKLDALAVAITYRDILNSLVVELDASPYERGSSGAFSRLIENPWRRLRARLAGVRGREVLAVSVRCPVCIAESAAGERAMDVLAQQIKDEKLSRTLAEGDPLCLAHTQGALRRSGWMPALMSRQHQGWSELRDRLLEFIRKSDHNHRWEELTDAERAAIVTSVRTVTGTRARPADDASAETRKLRRGGTNARRAP